ncbi:9-O-acetylesterase (plasmid) [Rufibacter tibetensis]|uniref:9-O-acetylesterase n=1 Tax=Rufibacter tibetensis TaxID=512763 RepID=A0A0P0C914_9BACT|nr:9-O-acetylesterase [Rufibacter tibetensis]
MLSGFFLLCLFPAVLYAEVKLPSLFTDNMVLQQQSQVSFWGWAKAGSTVSVTPSWSRKKYSARVGPDGKWRLQVATPSAGGPFEISISDGKPVRLTNVLIGEVWVCSGQSNMEMPMKGYKSQPIIGSNEAILKSRNKNIRIYTVPRSSQTAPQENSKPSPWKEAAPEAVANFSATAYYFGRLLNEVLDIPIGLIHTSYGGSTAEAWMTPKSLEPFEDIKVPKEGDKIPVVNRTPTTLYNGMLHPVIGYGMRGVIWYQGESNYDRPDQYEQLFPAMVKEWRSLWGAGDFPFYYAQITPYNYAQLPPYNRGGKYNSAFVRDAQRKSLGHIPNAGMAVLMDVGEENFIHPANKEAVGNRLAYLALSKTYGIKGFGYASPGYDTMAVTGNKVILRFKDAPNGLTSFSKELVNFEIAGSNKVFYPAHAVISGSTVSVSSPQVKEPVAVRYAFKDFIVGDLYSNEGLPVSSFRTDSWDQ